MIDSGKHLRKFGKVLDCEVLGANPELTNVKGNDISSKFPDSFKLYKHQVDAIEAFKQGKNVLLSAGTNSGKTEAAFLAIAESIKSGIPSQALFIYPTKALAADQKIRLDRYCTPYGWNVCVFDADNSSRYSELNRCEILLTNPHMLLVHLKNPHSTFLNSLKNLAYVVLDEIHCYTAYEINLLFAMMKFIQESLHTDFQLILLSATVGNPEEINQSLTKLFKRESTIIKGRAKHPTTRLYLLSSFRPNVLYSSYLPENEVAVKLIEKYAYDDASTLVFNDTRKDAAMIGQKAHSAVGDLVAIHYGSMDKIDRSKNEQDFRDGKIPVMVTVKTLQQGIDIGSVQRIVHVGLPFKQTDFWQRQGRMGRRANIEKCESVILPSPKMPFDMFIVSEKERFEDFLTKKIEKILLKHDSKIIRMFLGCMKVKHGLELDESEVDFLKAARLITTNVNLERFIGGAQTDFCLTDTGRKFLSKLNFYIGDSIVVKNVHGQKIPLGGTSISELQPNCIIFNNNIRSPRFYVVKTLHLNSGEAVVSPIEDEFDDDTCNKIRSWSMFSRTAIDFSMTNPDSTFGNIILKPSKVQHVEYVVRKENGKKRRVLRVLDEFENVVGYDEFLSNYVLSSIPPNFLRNAKEELKEAALLEVILDAAFSCIRNGLRSKFDIAYDEFSHLFGRIDEGNLSSTFIFFETSCSDTIRDINWTLVASGAKDFLKFVQASDEAGLFYLRGSRSYFKLIDGFKENRKKEIYNWIEKTIDMLIQAIIEKLELAKKVCENEKYCRVAQDTHTYSRTCKNALAELLAQQPHLKSIYGKLVVFYVDSYIESGWMLQNVTIAASRSSQIENRYVMFVSIPALAKLSESAISTLMMHELAHLQNIDEARPFQSDVEEEASVFEAVNREAMKNRKIKEGLNELNRYLESIQSENKYSLNDLLTIGGTIIENLRWEMIKGVKYIHWFCNGEEYHYHEIKTSA